MSFRVTLVLLSSLLSTQLGAQDVAYVPEGLASGSKTGPCNVFPFGVQKQEWISGNQKYQTLVPLSFLKSFRGSQIGEIAFAPCGSGVYEFQSIRITMAQTSASDLVKDFAKNLAANQKVVLDARSYHWHLNKDSWSAIGLQDPYRFDLTKGNLVIDIEARGAKYLNPNGSMGFHRVKNLRRLYDVGWKLAPPVSGTMSMAGLKVRISGGLAALGSFGLGCPGSNKKTQTLALSGIAKPGNTVTATYTNAPPLAPTFLLIGRSNKAPLPQPIGGGCMLYTFPDMLVFQAASATGSASVPLPVPPSTAFVGARLYTQFSAVDLEASKSGMVTSNYGRILIGR